MAGATVLRIIGQTGGGTRIYIYDLNKALEGRGIKTVTHLREPEFPDDYVGGKPGGLDYRYSLNIFKIIWSAFLFRDNLCYIHSHLRNATAIGFVISLILRTPHVITVHGPLYEGVVNIKDRIFCWIFRIACRRAKLVIFISEFTRKIVGSQIGLFEQEYNSIVVHNGSDVSDQSPAIDGTLNICIAGELTPRKNISHLRALCEMIEDADLSHKVNIDIFGEGPLRAEVFSIQEAYSFVKWHGFEQNADRIYMNSNLHVIFSETEGFGRVVTEAMARGIPTLAYPLGAFPEIIIDGYNGFLAKDLGSMLKIIRLLSEKSSLHRDISVNCRNHYKSNFTKDVFISRTLSAIDNATAISYWHVE